MNHIWVTEALNGPQKGHNMVLNGKFSQPYSQYPVQARASGGAVYPLCVSALRDSLQAHPTTNSWRKPCRSKTTCKSFNFSSPSNLQRNRYWYELSFQTEKLVEKNVLSLNDNTRFRSSNIRKEWRNFFGVWISETS